MNELRQLLQSIDIERKTRRLKPPKPQYIKPPSIRRLEADYDAYYYAKHADIPDYARVYKHFADDTANALTRAIMVWAEVNGASASRINTTGIYDVKRGIYRHSGATRGVADIDLIINGRAVKIEVKIGKDKQSEAQRLYQQRTEAAGGVYIIARNFDDFLEKISTCFQL
jgi:hypothetical protein